MENRKLTTNYAEVSGTVMDVYNDKVFNQGEDGERFQFNMKIEVEEGKVIEVKFSAKKSSKLYNGFCTIWDDVQTVVEHGRDNADRIKVTGRVTTNAYYSKGILNEKVEILVNSANREKDGKKFDNNASFATLGYILEHNKLEDGTANIRALINEYSFNGQIKGHEAIFSINEDVDDYLEFFPLKSVCSLEGMINTRRVEVKLTEEETKELSTEGVIGSAKKRIEEQNERRKKLREEGLFRDEVVLELTGGANGVTEDEIREHEYPFEERDINDMLDGIDDRLNKSLERDKKNNSQYYIGAINDDEVPF